MTTFTDMQNYKHDIPGKLKDISVIVNKMDENFIQNDDSLEALFAVHEILTKMINSSKSLISTCKDFESTLYIGKRETSKDLHQIQIEEITVNYEITGNSIIFSISNELKDLDTAVGKICALLPINNIERTHG